MSQLVSICWSSSSHVCRCYSGNSRMRNSSSLQSAGFHYLSYCNTSNFSRSWTLIYWLQQFSLWVYYTQQPHTTVKWMIVSEVSCAHLYINNNSHFINYSEWSIIPDMETGPVRIINDNWCVCSLSTTQKITLRYRQKLSWSFLTI